MCNLYVLTRSQDEIRGLFDGLIDRIGNLPSFDAIFPDYEAPVVRMPGGAPELVKARWGMPSPAFAWARRRTDPGVTNIRNPG